MIPRLRLFNFRRLAAFFATMITIASVGPVGNRCLAANAAPERFLRFEKSGVIAYGVLEDESRVRQIAGDLFGSWSRTRKIHRLDEVKILPPTVPTQVLALAGNYLSHHDLTAVPPKFQIPQPFLKSPSCRIGPGEAGVIPTDARDVHF